MTNQEIIFWIVTGGLSLAVVGGTLLYVFGALIIGRMGNMK
jgi:hypothetical protein